ncbi:MAG: guanylate kinase [Jaaginema sp. PMC 1079.18]|nr:guanylate kinase [Jaaginema sp. PMC 1080.18]MEC4853233.1 guanylate kinase [Jaaginema sp. PMC 1079.18]MEC4867357.1 guanylate kinase [Jaaginema sp. PMC 1078.18]
MSAGQLIVITGPSGVGKGTLVRLLLARHPELYLSTSTTTRHPRPGEVEGKDYYFVNRPQFAALIETGQLLEWAEYAGNYYGTPRINVENRIAQGCLVLLEIEVVGAQQIKQTFPQALRLFILPPSLAELERRLRDRGTDAASQIAQRLKRAETEIALSPEFDFQIVNDDLDQALEKMERAIFSASSVVCKE